jgi:hypothetical protein
MAGQGPGRGKAAQEEGGETGWDRVAAQREGRREWAGLEGKEAKRLLGWVEVAWDEHYVGWQGGVGQ